MSNYDTDELTEMINKTAKFVKKNLENPENRDKLMQFGKIAFSVGKNLKDQVADNIDMDDFSDMKDKINSKKNINLDDILSKLNKL